MMAKLCKMNDHSTPLAALVANAPPKPFTAHILVATFAFLTSVMIWNGLHGHTVFHDFHGGQGATPLPWNGQFCTTRCQNIKKRLANQKPRSATFTTCGANGWNGGSPFHGARGEKNGCSWNSCAVFSMRQALIIPWRILWVPLETNWPCILNESQLWIPLNPFQKFGLNKLQTIPTNIYNPKTNDFTSSKITPWNCLMLPQVAFWKPFKWIAAHSKLIYTICMHGFSKGFEYLCIFGWGLVLLMPSSWAN